MVCSIGHDKRNKFYGRDGLAVVVVLRRHIDKARDPAKLVMKLPAVAGIKTVAAGGLHINIFAVNVNHHKCVVYGFYPGDIKAYGFG